MKKTNKTDRKKFLLFASRTIVASTLVGSAGYLLKHANKGIAVDCVFASNGYCSNCPSCRNSQQKPQNKNNDTTEKKSK